MNLRDKEIQTEAEIQNREEGEREAEVNGMLERLKSVDLKVLLKLVINTFI